jgi:hypothetical protein
MEQLSTEDRFVLFVVRTSHHDLSAMAVSRLTSLPSVVVTKAIKELESRRLIEPIEHHGDICYLPIGLSQSPLMNDYGAWLDAYCSRPAPIDEGDTEAMTFMSCGIVILSAILTGSRDAQFLTRLTTFPEAFVRLVVGMMDRLDLWWSERLFDLETTIQQPSLDFTEVDVSLHSVTEEFWNAWRSPGLGAAIDTLRAGRQYGGLRDWWIDKNSSVGGPFLVM